MGSHDRRAAELAAQRLDHTGKKTGNARLDRRPQRSMPLMRRYEAAGLVSADKVAERVRILPADPHLDEAFCAFTHGTLIATPDGPVAVEDLVPGMLVRTADAGLRPLVWIGSTLLPPAPESGPQMTRFIAEGLGIDRPMADLVLGPRARVVSQHHGCHALCGGPSALVPAATLTDGHAVISLRVVRPMRVYHLGLLRHHILVANGVEVESYHPGENAMARLDPSLQEAFLELFPHLHGTGDFGPLVMPRLSTHEAESLRGAA
ncbi:Hint domain-containing protein [Rhodovulum adriaticum]|uniref:Hint domain-containing protein n=1 Tax=Rhodovulum adriaticum TaxID=35804 RepID=A0A4R2NWM5_RHOAD|nr:Hint domain-containing protein [Rhodovulum adriaticum]MBK1635256.1 hypothetical protein [Rhodovulum adriaticum]TCP26392.1 Hint domain-containing protein [Rhodovulum adriaticum]